MSPQVINHYNHCDFHMIEQGDNSIASTGAETRIGQAAAGAGARQRSGGSSKVKWTAVVVAVATAVGAVAVFGSSEMGQALVGRLMGRPDPAAKVKP